MHNYAIAEIGGRQFRIEEGEMVVVPRLQEEVGATVTLDKVLLLNKDGEVKVGMPYLDGVAAEAKVVDHHKSRKVFVYKKKRRKHFRKSATSRQHLTTLEIATLGS